MGPHKYMYIVNVGYLKMINLRSSSNVQSYKCFYFLTLTNYKSCEVYLALVIILHTLHHFKVQRIILRKI